MHWGESATATILEARESLIRRCLSLVLANEGDCYAANSDHIDEEEKEEAENDDVVGVFSCMPF